MGETTCGQSWSSFFGTQCNISAV